MRMSASQMSLLTNVLYIVPGVSAMEVFRYKKKPVRSTPHHTVKSGKRSEWKGGKAESRTEFRSPIRSFSAHTGKREPPFLPTATTQPRTNQRREKKHRWSLVSDSCHPHIRLRSSRGLESSPSASARCAFFSFPIVRSGEGPRTDDSGSRVLVERRPCSTKHGSRMGRRPVQSTYASYVCSTSRKQADSSAVPVSQVLWPRAESLSRSRDRIRDNQPADGRLTCANSDVSFYICTTAHTPQKAVHAAIM